MSNEALTRLTATEAAGLIRRRQLSPVDYVDAVLSRIAALQPTLNCFITVVADQARADAIAAEAAVMAGGPLGPLHGVPVSIKDLIPTQGIRTTFGSVAFADHVPEQDDILVTRLRAAGAVVIGKTTTPEFGIKGQCDAPIFGTTRNPWDLGRSPGGSSGGAAAAVAAGLGPIALGSDGAGSIRIPAACCGLVGFKGTTGALPYAEARDAFGNVVAAGPLTRSIADAVLMQSAMAGADARDPWTANTAPLGRLATGRDLSGLKIGYLRLAANRALAADVSANTLASIEVLRSLGAEVEEVSQQVDWISEDQRVLYLSSIAHNLGSVVDRFGDRTDRVLRAYVATGRQYEIGAYIRAISARTRLFRAVQRLFESYDFLVSPTLSCTALPAGFDGAADSVVVDGQAMGPVQPEWTGYVYPFNLTGHPALSVPSGFASDGLPTGFQIVGPRHGDAEVLRLGALIEQARPWADRWPCSRQP